MGQGSAVGRAPGWGLHGIGKCSWYSDWVRAGWFRDRILVGGEIFHTCPDWPWGPSSLLYNGYQVFPRVKWPGRDVDHLPPSHAEVKERVELYLYSPSGPPLPVVG
jgi:hypothetical protein